MGQVSQEMLQDYASDFLPVSSCPDGWRAWRHVPGTAAEGNKKLLMEFLSIESDNFLLNSSWFSIRDYERGRDR